MSHFLKVARVWSTRSRPNFRTRNASPPRRPMYQSARAPGQRARVAASTYIHAVDGSAADDVTTSTSLISGTLRKDESKNATTKRPKGPSVGMRTVWIQTTMPCIGTSIRARGGILRRRGRSRTARRSGPSRPRSRAGARIPSAEKWSLSSSRKRCLEARPSSPWSTALLDGGDEGQLAEPGAQQLLPLRLLGRRHPAPVRGQLDVPRGDPHQPQPLGRLGDGEQVVELVAQRAAELVQVLLLARHLLQVLEQAEDHPDRGVRQRLP